MCHRLSGLTTYGSKGHRKGDEHLDYASEKHGMLYLFLLLAHYVPNVAKRST